jgi:tRNA dimethylallyltransferase
MEVISREPGRHLALVGPTTSGKTAVGIEIARERIAAGIPTEIISCDSMQVYRGMDIGTDKPSRAARSEIPHHLLDVVDPTEEYHLAEYLDSVEEVLAGVESRGATAILLGGTGLYVRAVTDGFRPPPSHPEVAKRLDEQSTDQLTERLRELDPLALSRIPPNNRRRLIRALEVTIGEGKPFSGFGTALENYGTTPFVLTGLWPTRSDVTQRIALRYERQVTDGMIAECRALVELGPRLSRTAGQALGYRELMSHLRGECTLEAALEAARVRTRKFAVRQMRWFRRDPRITWFPAPRLDGDTQADGETRPDGGARHESDPGTDPEAFAPSGRLAGQASPQTPEPVLQHVAIRDISGVAEAINELWRKRAVDCVGSRVTVGSQA